MWYGTFKGSNDIGKHKPRREDWTILRIEKVILLNRVARVSLIEKMTFEQELYETRKLIMWKFEKKMFLAEKMDREGQCT